MRLCILGFIALAACTNGGNSNVGTDDTAGCEGCGDDTGAQTQTSFVSVEVYVPSEVDVVSCHAELTGPEAYAFDTVGEDGNPIVKPVLVGDYTVKVGDPANLTSYGTSIHTASDSSMSIAPADASANIGVATELEPQIVAIDNIPYFAGTYSCGYDEYAYDPDMPDFKSGEPRHLGDWTVKVEVQANGKVEAIGDSSEFGVLSLDSYFIVMPDNTLDVVFYQGDAAGMSLGYSQIDVSSFAATVIDTNYQVVEDLLCTQ